MKKVDGILGLARARGFRIGVQQISHVGLWNEAADMRTKSLVNAFESGRFASSS